MAKKDTKALQGGKSCFNQDGSPVAAVWKALTKVTDECDANTSKLDNRTKDRNAIEKQLAEMDEGSPDFEHKTSELYLATKEIKLLRDLRDQFPSRFTRIIRLTNENHFGPAMSAKEIIESADEAGEGEGEEDPEQLKLAPAASVRPDGLFTDWATLMPEAFGDREPGVLKPHLEKLYTPDRCSPLKLMRWLAEQFKIHKTSKDRQELLPGPAWFNAGLMACVARASTGETCKGDAHGESAAADVLRFMAACAATDIDAWLNLTGGKDSPANKALLKASA